MFCYKCGYEIPDDALFCSRCGVPQNVKIVQVQTVEELDSVQQIQTTENALAKKDLEDEGMKIYLSNVLALECMKVKLNKDYCETEKKYQYEYANNFVKRYEAEKGYIWFAYFDNNYYLGAFTEGGGIGGAYTGDFLNIEQINAGNGFIAYVWGEGVIKHTGRFYWAPINDDTWSTITKASFWWDVGGSNILQQKSREMSIRDDFYNLYDEFKEEAAQKYQENLIDIVNPLKEKLDGISEEYKKADSLLQAAYAVNIIPQQYRNIHAIWFIHDFITTSNENLASALLHCDLDEIKQKLDTIIEQQKEIIINQSVMMAQNEQLINQNQQTLDKLANIETNTAKASQYAKIAANNAEACAWIGIAQYIS